MAEEFKLAAQQRTEVGSAHCRRLRRRGLVPGNVYGHNEPPVSIAVAQETLDPIVHAGHRVVTLELDGTSDTAMFQELQWDTYGTRIQHFDLIRVSADERVTVEVPLELKGTAHGVTAGGMLEQFLRELTVECVPSQIPDSIAVNVTQLEIGDSLLVADLHVPEGLTVQDPPDATVLQIVEAVAAPTPEEIAAETAVEPELIRETDAASEDEEKD